MWYQWLPKDGGGGVIERVNAQRQKGCDKNEFNVGKTNVAPNCSRIEICGIRDSKHHLIPISNVFLAPIKRTIFWNIWISSEHASMKDVVSGIVA